MQKIAACLTILQKSHQTDAVTTAIGAYINWSVAQKVRCVQNLSTKIEATFFSVLSSSVLKLIS
jgi:hypothetical protein